MSQAAYRTLYRQSQVEIVIKKSRFIGRGFPVEDEEQALSHLSFLRSQFKDASHHCYAYILGKNQGIMRYSDDGEPGGTAGMPIIEVLRAHGLTDCLMVVTRYFGGVLLGAGGLVRAYTQGAAEAVRAAGVAEMQPSQICLLEVPYPMLGRVEHYLKTASCILKDKDFSDIVTLTLQVKDIDCEAFAQDLTALSDGTLELLPMERMYAPYLLS